MSTQALSPVPSPKPSAALQLLQLSAGFMLSSGIYAAIKLNVADLLASGAKSVTDLASATGANEDALYRVLRLLCACGVFNEIGLRYFHNNEVSELLRSDVPNSQRDLMCWVSSPVHNRVYAEFLHSVMTGEPAIEKATGMRCFEYFQTHGDVADEFNAGMTGFSAMTVPALLESYDFSGIGTLVDVAGGHGYLLCSILRKYPDMQGILFDVDPVIEGCGAILQGMGVAGRCRTASGDFFREIPAGGDVYMMQHIIHDWDDDKALTILRNTRRALDGKPDGRILALEEVIMPGNDISYAKLVDLEMLAMPGGRERTQEEYASLFARAGFELKRVVLTGAPINVIEGVIA